MLFNILINQLIPPIFLFLRTSAYGHIHVPKHINPQSCSISPHGHAHLFSLRACYVYIIPPINPCTRQLITIHIYISSRRCVRLYLRSLMSSLDMLFHLHASPGPSLFPLPSLPFPFFFFFPVSPPGPPPSTYSTQLTAAAATHTYGSI